MSTLKYYFLIGFGILALSGFIILFVSLFVTLLPFIIIISLLIAVFGRRAARVSYVTKGSCRPEEFSSNNNSESTFQTEPHPDDDVITIEAKTVSADTDTDKP